MSRSWTVTAAFLAAALAASALVSRRGAVRMAEDRLPGLPLDLAGWQGTDRRFDDGVYKTVDADATLLRRYEKDGAVLWLYVGYYGTRKGGRTGHLPVYCYPGAGWEIEEKGVEEVPAPGGGPARANRLLVRQGADRTLALYWIQTGDGRVLESGWRMNLHRFGRRVLRNRDDGALVRISAPVDEDGPSAALVREKAFAAALTGELSRHWPVEEDEKN